MMIPFKKNKTKCPKCGLKRHEGGCRPEDIKENVKKQETIWNKRGK